MIYTLIKGAIDYIIGNIINNFKERGRKLC